MSMFVEGCLLPCDYCNLHAEKLEMVVVSPEQGPVVTYWACDPCLREAVNHV